MPAPRTPGEMLKVMREKIEGRTGRSFEGWVEVARGSGIPKHAALTAWLKAEHGLNHNEAQWIAWGVVDPDRVDRYDRPDELVDELYSGKKAQLRPIYDRLVALGREIAPDATLTVCKTYASLAGPTQFAIFAPRTLKGVDVELVLPPGAAGGRLEAFESSNPKFNARVRVAGADEVDDELAAALRQAADFVRG